ncbi:hypothetical protein C8J56DRAFT_267794 [Mycena floridula]|nr:hypothetical protein C8J56DRAFT_267794 [Mycena floridula]
MALFKYFAEPCLSQSARYFSSSLVFLLAFIFPTKALTLVLDPTEGTRFAVGTYVDYTWSTSVDTDSDLIFCRVRLKQSSSTGEHVGSTGHRINITQPQNGNESGNASFLLSPVDEGSYVLNAFLLSTDPGGQPNGELDLASSDFFDIFHSDTASATTQSPTSTLTSISQSSTSISTTFPTTTSSETKASQTAIIAGSVCGGIIFLLVLLGGLLLVVRWDRKRHASQFHSNSMVAGRHQSSSNHYAAARLSAFDVEPFQYPPASFGSTWSKSRFTESTIPTERQVQLRNELTERVVELERAMSLQVVTSAVENAQLRTQVQWLRDNQESDWALGLTDELPPSYRDIMRSSRTRQL